MPASNAMAGWAIFAKSAIERLWRDARILAIGGGATEVMLEEAAKRLYRRAPSEKPIPRLRIPECLEIHPPTTYETVDGVAATP